MKNLNLTLILLLLAVISFAQNVPSYVPTNGLVGWWPFNGNANDESGNGNNGTVNGATLTTDRFGNIGKAYDFDGVNDEITVNGTDFGTSPFTISGWFLIDSPLVQNLSSNLKQIFMAGNAVNYQKVIEIGIFKQTQNWQYVMNMRETSTNNIMLSPFNIDYNWGHFIYVNNSNLTEMYINGIKVDTLQHSLTDVMDNGSYVFGNGQGAVNNRWWEGKLDDIGIWNRALTQQEISNLYNGGICYQTITVTDTLLINTGITGFNPVTYENTIRIWPNPTYDHITIDAGNLNTMSGYSIRIVNALGQQMFQSAINQQQFYLDLSSWTGNGIYYVNIINPQGVTIDTRKIVLQ
jgi:hypothetical protein